MKITVLQKVNLGLLGFALLGVFGLLAYRHFNVRESLHEAVYAGDEARVRELIAAGWDVNAPSRYGHISDHRPWLERLVKSPEEDANRLCCFKGQQAFWQWYPGCAPLHVAVLANRRDIAELLIKAGADVNLNWNGNTPLLLCFDRGVLGVLLAAGANVNARNGQGDTHLHQLSAQSVSPQTSTGDYAACVQMLLSAGAKADAVDNAVRTPLHSLAVCGDVSLIQTLLTAGAEINAPDRDGQTPLHVAYSLNRDEAVKRLLAAGADPNAKDNNGRTPEEMKPTPR